MGKGGERGEGRGGKERGEGEGAVRKERGRGEGGKGGVFPQMKILAVMSKTLWGTMKMTAILHNALTLSVGELSV